MDSKIQNIVPYPIPILPTPSIHIQLVLDKDSGISDILLIDQYSMLFCIVESYYIRHGPEYKGNMDFTGVLCKQIPAFH